MSDEIKASEKIHLIQRILNFYFKDKIILSAEDLLLKINDICYCESMDEFQKLIHP